MKKYRIILTFLMLFLISGLIYQAKADMGPKATSDIEIIGIDEAYYFDILFEVDERSAVLLDEERIQQEIEYDYYRDNFPDVLNGYRDSDGFASYTLYRGIPHYISKTEGSDHLYHLGYFSPPDTFKVVIVTDAGKMFVSEIVNKTRFYASFEYDITDVTLVDGQNIYLNAGTIVEVNSIQYGNLVFLVLVLILATLIVELLILLAFGYEDKKAYVKVGIVNIITQIILQLLIFYGYVYVWNIFGAFIFLIIGEVIVFIIEIIAYRRILKEKSKGRATVYAIIANIASFILGLVSLGYLINLINWWLI